MMSDRSPWLILNQTDMKSDTSPYQTNHLDWYNRQITLTHTTMPDHFGSNAIRQITLTEMTSDWSPRLKWHQTDQLLLMVRISIWACTHDFGTLESRHKVWVLRKIRSKLRSLVPLHGQLTWYTNGFFLLVWYNKHGIVHCTYLGM